MLFSSETEQNNFAHAARDYLFLLDRDYPEKGAGELVGDRYRLTRESRCILYRGICSAGSAEKQRRKLKNPSEFIDENTQDLHIDGYNVLFTIYNYRRGVKLFLSNDGLLRDTGRMHGRIYSKELFEESLTALVLYLLSIEKNMPGTFRFFLYLDRPVTRSAQHEKLLRSLCRVEGLYLKRKRPASADAELKMIKTGILATADSEIIRHTEIPVMDLARHILRFHYQGEFFDLRRVL